MAIEKIKILGAVLELLAKQHCQFSQSTKKMGQMGRMGADYTFALISIKTCAPQFK